MTASPALVLLAALCATPALAAPDSLRFTLPAIGATAFCEDTSVAIHYLKGAEIEIERWDCCDVPPLIVTLGGSDIQGKEGRRIAVAWPATAPPGLYGIRVRTMNTLTGLETGTSCWSPQISYDTRPPRFTPRPRLWWQWERTR